MSYTIPNDSDPAYFDTEFQSRIFAADYDILQAAIGGRNGVISGCGVSPDSPASMTVVVASGAIASDAVAYAVTGADVAIADPDSDPRFDLIIAQSDGTVDVITGAADPSPLLPSPAEVPGSVALAAVFVPAAATAIAATLITDKRISVTDPTAPTVGWTTISASVDRSRSNTATLAVDDDLTFTMAASTKYRVRGYLVFAHTAGSASQTVKFGIGGPASPTFLHGTIAIRTRVQPTTFAIGDTLFLGGFSVFNTTTGLGAGSMSTFPALSAASYSVAIEVTATVHNGSNSGTFAPWWSQVTASSATTMTRMAGSYLEYFVV